MVTITEKIEDRFWDKVDRADENSCWMWTAAKRRGYGVLSVGRTTVNAHRISYMIDNGEEPEEMVLHICDNPPCVNPNHLYEGNASENAHDWYERQDAADNLLGEDNPNSKLTESEVKEIKHRLNSESVSTLASDFGVANSTIAHIKYEYNWTDVEP